MKLTDDTIMMTIIMTMVLIINGPYVWSGWDLTGSGIGLIADLH